MMASEGQSVTEIRDAVLARLSGVRQGEGYWQALCPAHDDHNPSLSVREHADGVSVKCHAGCPSESVLAAINLTKRDLYLRPVSPSSVGSQYYYYEDENGEPLFRVWRTPSKKFIQQRYEGGRYENGLGLIDPVLYRLPELNGAEPGATVFVVEGEKDVDRLRSLGLLATTNPMGAGAWKEEYRHLLLNFRVRIIPDNDTVGESHAKRIYESLKDGDVKILRLPGLPHKGDVSDWLNNGGDRDGLLALETGCSEPKQVGVGRLGLQNGNQLMAKKFPPKKWAVPDLIPAGTMIFGGAPKMGKSLLVLGLCMSVATGGKALGAIPVQQGDSLYLALEDTEERVQERSFNIRKTDFVGSQDFSRWQYKAFGAPRRIDQGLLDDIENEFINNSEDPRLIVIDTLASVKAPGGKSQNMYEQDYGAVQEITSLAGQYKVAILIVTHLNQGEHRDHMNKITGSTGLTGGVDGALVLDRVRGEADAVLRAWHRDLKEDPEIAMEKVEGERGYWRYMGDAEEYRIGKERREILEVLNNADEPMRPVDIAELLDKKSNSVSQALGRMQKEGYVKNPQYGKYVAIAEVPTLSPRHGCHSVIPNPKSESKDRHYDNHDGSYGGDEEEGAEF